MVQATVEFYCLKCKQVHEITSKDRVFKTGFKQVNKVEYPMGYCEEKESGSNGSN